MKILVGVLFLLPLAAMVVGFLLARSQFFRSVRKTGGFDSAGRPIRRYTPRAALAGVEEAPAVPGRGTLMLTDRALVFERFFPRREFRVELGRLREARITPGSRGGSDLRLRWDRREIPWASGMRIRVPDPEGWAAAIERARASDPPSA